MDDVEVAMPGTSDLLPHCFQRRTVEIVRRKRIEKAAGIRLLWLEDEVDVPGEPRVAANDRRHATRDRAVKPQALHRRHKQANQIRLGHRPPPP